MDKLIDLIKKTNTEAYKQLGLHTFINPFSYLKIRKRGLLESFDFIYVDGIFLVKILRLVGIKVNRNSFDMTSLAPKVFSDSTKNSKNIYFIGSTENAIARFAKVIGSGFPEMLIAGNRNGYFINEGEREEVIQNIVSLNPDVVIVGMGTPFQEKFLIDLKKGGWRGKGFTCGGFIHQTAKGLNYYPKFYNKYNLRWLYRIIDEPKLIKRYLLFYPLSICLFTFDFIRCKLTR